MIWNIDFYLSVSCHPNDCRGLWGQVVRLGEVALWLELRAIGLGIKRSRVEAVEGDREIRRAIGEHPVV